MVGAEARPRAAAAESSSTSDRQRASKRRQVGRMSQSRRFLIRMVLFLVLVAGLAALLGRSLVNAFMGNPAVNGVILGILIAGIIYIFRQVLLLDPELEWIENFRSRQTDDDSAISATRSPRLLGPMARMLGAQKGRRVSLSATSLQALLDG